MTKVKEKLVFLALLATDSNSGHLYGCRLSWSDVHPYFTIDTSSGNILNVLAVYVFAL